MRSEALSGRMTESGAFFSIERSESSVDLLVASRRSVNVFIRVSSRHRESADASTNARNIKRLQISKPRPITWPAGGSTACDHEVL